MIRSLVHEQNHSRILFLKLRQIIQKWIAISVIIPPEQLSPIFRQSTKPHNPAMGTSNKHTRLTPFQSPYSTHLNIIHKCTFILNNYLPLFWLTCRVARVFFKNSSLSPSFENA